MTLALLGPLGFVTFVRGAGYASHRSIVVFHWPLRPLVIMVVGVVIIALEHARFGQGRCPGFRGEPTVGWLFNLAVIAVAVG